MEKQKGGTYMKINLKRIVSLSFILIVGMSMTALADSYKKMMYDGNAYMYCNHQNGTKQVSAGTNAGTGRESDLVFLKVTTTYDNGDTYEYRTSISTGNKHYNSGYEWAEDYAGVHKLYYSAENCYDTAYTAEY